ncbi:uncharacterized protein LOC129594309 [Paramacrobiotus metropolitanus]|uniref:uncharacterized protein LOC129594309 n=1 Tax=Paramacrobiotus metropolitanus TaxID=2943436 RepID=UPI002446233C|nr:uncharacterized protein LOC129594309 [Paramacrobiotus metropolitanus]
MDHIETEEVSGPTEDDQTEEDLYETAEQNGGEFEMHLSVPADEEDSADVQHGMRTGVKSDNGLPGSGPGARSVQNEKRRTKRAAPVLSGNDIESSSKRRRRLIVVSPTEELPAGHRPFQLKWLLEFEWLRFDPDKKRMYCNWCAECNKKNAFGKADGTNNFRKSNCEEHSRSRDHKDATVQRSRQNSFQHEVHVLNEATGSVVTSARGADGSTVYQASTINYANPMSPAEVRFHAKKASMLLSGLLVTKNLPPSLSKDFLEIMPFMFPDSKIAADLGNF